jgi:acyl-CoA reductase-like NAD-dependent aldehyde dehydrogenase
MVAGVAVSPDHFIGGKRVASTERFEDRTPIDEQVIAEVARGGEAEVELAVEAAARAFSSTRTWIASPRSNASTSPCSGARSERG